MKFLKWILRGMPRCEYCRKRLDYKRHIITGRCHNCAVKININLRRELESRNI